MPSVRQEGLVLFLDLLKTGKTGQHDFPAEIVEIHGHFHVTLALLQRNNRSLTVAFLNDPVAGLQIRGIF